MMSAGADALGLAALVFVLGLKHGLDPDHLVAIDGLTRSSRSRWCGLFFSLGHGCGVTLVGVVFTLGMVFTDALNGLWVARLIRGADRSAAAASRGMSAAIALLCLVLATFGFVKYLLPELADFADSLAPLLSAASLAGVFIAYLVARRLRGVAPVLR